MDFLTPGEKIKRFRKLLGMTQQQLEEAGISRNFISMIESNKRSLPKEVARKLIDIFNRKSKEQHLDLKLDVENVLTEPEAEAELYCRSILEGPVTIDSIDEVINVAKKFSLSEILTKAYIVKGDMLYEATDYVAAFASYYEALESHRNNNQVEFVSFLHNKLGKCKLMLLEYEEALVFFNKAYHYSIIHKDSSTRKNTHYNLALTYMNVGNFDKGLVYINEYLNACNTLTELNEYANANILKANCYKRMKQYDKCIHCYNDLFKKISEQNSALMGYICNNLGLIHIELKKPKKALAYFEEAEIIREKYDPQLLSHTIIDKSELYIKNASYGDAEELLNTGIKLAENYNDKVYLLRAYCLLELLYTSVNDKDKLEKVYYKIIPLLRLKNDHVELKNVHIKLSLLYLEKNEIARAKSILKESILSENSN